MRKTIDTDEPTEVRTIKCDVTEEAIKAAITNDFLEFCHWPKGECYDGPWVWEVVSTYDKNGDDVTEVGYDSDEGSQWPWWPVFWVVGNDGCRYKFQPILLQWGNDQLNCYEAIEA